MPKKKQPKMSTKTSTALVVIPDMEVTITGKPVVQKKRR